LRPRAEALCGRERERASFPPSVSRRQMRVIVEGACADCPRLPPDTLPAPVFLNALDKKNSSRRPEAPDDEGRVHARVRMRERLRPQP